MGLFCSYAMKPITEKMTILANILVDVLIADRITASLDEKKKNNHISNVILVLR